jgi:cell pole-organizing protein PopZ
MSAEQAQREPTMEEILASIRRIISEEDKPADAGGDVLDLQPPPAPVVEAKAPPQAAPAPAPQPIPAVFEEEEPAPPARPIEDDLMVVEDEEPVFTPPPAPTPEPVRAAAPAPAPEPVAPQAEWRPMEQKTLTSEPVASQAAGALSKLMGSMLVSSGATLDDVVRELLKPMLKQWLDANLPQIVEAEVAKEIDRIRRMAR